VWKELGEPSAIQLVEVGPGRGTLMADVIRAASKFPAFADALSCHMVEVSPELRKIQQKSVCGSDATSEYDSETGHLTSSAGASGKDGHAGVQLSWHDTFADVPHDSGVPLIVLGQEFLDALPVHQFEKTHLGWCERLVDLAEPGAPADASADETQERPWFRLVNSPGKTPATVAYIQDQFGTGQVGDSLEVCPAACAVVQDVALRLQRDGGAALFIDYGPGLEEGPPAQSVRSIAKHGFLHFLHKPGQVDVTVCYFLRAVEMWWGCVDNK